jgi:uncharacterized protein (TIGR00251 family)
MSGDWCCAAPGGIRIAVQLAPNAKKTEVTGVHDGALKIRLQAPPVEGKANEALLRFLAERLQAPKSAVRLLHGQTSKRKLVEVTGLNPEAAAQLLVAVA